MPLSEAAAALLRVVLEDRERLIDVATDRVYYGTPDLAGRRPRLVTRMLVDRVFGSSEIALLRDDESEIELFMDQVTGMRAESDYHVSTMLNGMYSFRFGIEAHVRALATDGWVAWELLTAADELYMRTGPRAAALLLERQHGAALQRVAALERQHGKLVEQRRASEEALAAVRAEHDAATLALERCQRDLRERKALIMALGRPPGEPHA